ncbi:MAG: DNA polymerase III subunit gamma/tau [Candidatus Acidiferrales bacterium]|jgi:DNA polymerase-3 subunit gamma/tau
MAYQVIARKWRPQTFADVVGQRHVTQTLENAIKANRVAHAYIFSGVRGVGKTTTARILAKAMNCVKGPTATPCNECDSCREITSGNSLDVLEIDAASNRGIDQIRELREMVRYAALGRYKIVILDEAHQLTDEASNALLKTLEEPPEKVIFILATTQPEDLADTIKSRAQLFQFRALTFAEISDAITRIAKAENLKIDSGAVAVMARAAEGSLRDSLSLLEQALAYCGDHITDAQVRELLGVVAEDILDQLITAIHGQSTEQALALVHRLIAEGHNLQHFCREAIRHVRNLLVAKVCGEESELITAPVDERPRLGEQTAFFGEEDLTRFFQILLSTDDDLRRKPDPRLHLELGLLKLVTAKRLAPLEEVIAGMREGGSPRAASPAKSFAATASAAPTAPIAARTAPASTMPTPPTTKGEPRARYAVPTGAAGSSPRSSAPEPAPARNSPAAALPPRVVANSIEAETSGLAAAQYQAIKAALQEQKFLSSMVEYVTRWELEGNEIRLFFPMDKRTLAEMLQARDPMERLRTLTSEVIGQPLRVCVKLEPVRTGVARGSDLQARFEQDPIVRAMLERFGGRISGVKRRGEE